MFTGMLLSASPAQAQPASQPSTQPAAAPSPAEAKAVVDRLIAANNLALRNRTDKERDRVSFRFDSAAMGCRIYVQTKDDHRAALIVDINGLPYALARDGYTLYIDRESGQSLLLYKGGNAVVQFSSEENEQSLTVLAGGLLDATGGINVDIASVLRMTLRSPDLQFDWGLNGEVFIRRATGSFVRLWLRPAPEGRAPARTTITGKSASCALTAVGDGIPAITVNNKPLMIDTGASCMIMTREGYRGMGARSEEGGRLVPFSDVTGREQLATAIRMSQFTLDAVRFEDLVLLLADLTPVTERVDKSISGVLGLRLFGGCAMTLDQAKGRFQLDEERLPAPNDRDILPMRWSRRAAAEVPIKLQGKTLWATLDTGDSTPGLTLGGAVARTLEFTSPPVPLPGYFIGAIGATTGKVARLKGDLLLGTHVIRQPLVEILGEDDRVVLGNPLMAQFAMTIDQRAMAVRFTRDKAEPIVTPAMVDFDLGLDPSDRLLRVNGKPAEQFRITQWARLRKLGYPVELVVDRGGKEVTLTANLKTIVP
ncbi:MAG: aspartyl protease family protein [Planctomycetota bacterium]|nr:aspartyl protease family protein [Planctomycetota bacterium]